MALLKEHEKYHAMSPAQVLKNEPHTTMIDVAKNTTHTGEQFHVQCPVYLTDTREELNDRLQFFLSIMQDRLEQENKAMMIANEEAQKTNLAKEAMRRNSSLHGQRRKELIKLAKANKWTADEVDRQMKELEAKFQAAQLQLAEGTASEELMATLRDPENVAKLGEAVEQRMQ